MLYLRNRWSGGRLTKLIMSLLVSEQEEVKEKTMKEISNLVVVYAPGTILVGASYLLGRYTM